MLTSCYMHTQCGGLGKVYSDFPGILLFRKASCQVPGNLHWLGDIYKTQITPLPKAQGSLQMRKHKGCKATVGGVSAGHSVRGVSAGQNRTAAHMKSQLGCMSKTCAARARPHPAWSWELGMNSYPIHGATGNCYPVGEKRRVFYSSVTPHQSTMLQRESAVSTICTAPIGLEGEEEDTTFVVYGRRDGSWRRWGQWNIFLNYNFF